MKRALKKQIFFTALFAFLLFLAAEGAARLVLGHDPVFYRIKGNDSASYRLDWLRRHRGPAKEFDFAYDIHHPRRGWALKPGLDRLQAYGEDVSSNSRGIRGKKEYGYEKPEGVTRLLMIGDSFTFGEEVGDEETFSHLLERMIPDSEVINMGVHGYGHDQMLLYLKEEGLKYEPDIVVLGFLYYDMERNLLSFRDYAKPRLRPSRQGLQAVDVPVPPPRELARKELLRPKLFDLFEIVKGRILEKSGEKDALAKKQAAVILDEMIDAIRAAGAVPVFVYFVNESDFRDFFDRSPERERFFLDFCAARPGLYCASTRPAFLEKIKAGEDVDYYGHWDEKGHRITAGVIRDFLEEVKLIPGNAVPDTGPDIMDA